MSTRIPTDLLSTYDVMFMFNVRVQAIIRWRKALNMPFYWIGGTTKCPPVRHSLKETLRWAKKTKKEVVRVPSIQPNGRVVWSEANKFEAFQRGIS